MRRILVATLVLTAAAASAHAQETVLLRIGGQAGSVNHYLSVMETFVRGGQLAAMMPDTTVPFQRMTTYATRTLTAVSGDTLTFQEVVDSAKAEVPGMPQMAAMAPSMAAALQGRTTITRMDDRARIYSQEVTGGMAGMAGAGGQGMGAPGAPGAMGGGGRGTGGAGRMGGSARALFVLPARAVRVGESWADSVQTPGDGGAMTNTVATLTLVRVERNGGSRIAVVSMNGNQVSQTPMGPQNFSFTSELQIDLTGHRLARMAMTLTGTVQSRQGEMPVKIQMTQSLF
jgi:hypothetical protein